MIGSAKDIALQVKKSFLGIWMKAGFHVLDAPSGFYLSENIPFD